MSAIRATFARIKPGDPPSVSFNKVLTRPDGKQKYVAMSIPVRDQRLLARAEMELSFGDKVDVTVETQWAAKDIPNTLLDFTKVSVPQDKTLLAVR